MGLNAALPPFARHPVIPGSRPYRRVVGGTLRLNRGGPQRNARTSVEGGAAGTRTFFREPNIASPYDRRDFSRTRTMFGHMMARGDVSSGWSWKDRALWPLSCLRSPRTSSHRLPYFSLPPVCPCDDDHIPRVPADGSGASPHLSGRFYAVGPWCLSF